MGACEVFRKGKSFVDVADAIILGLERQKWVMIAIILSFFLTYQKARWRGVKSAVSGLEDCKFELSGMVYWISRPGSPKPQHSTATSIRMLLQARKQAEDTNPG